MLADFRASKSHARLAANQGLHRELTAMRLRRPAMQFHRRDAVERDATTSHDRRSRVSPRSHRHQPHASSEAPTSQAVMGRAQLRNLRATMNAHGVFRAVLDAVAESLNSPVQMLISTKP